MTVAIISPVATAFEAFAPPPEFTISQWADAERVLPETSAARGGRWNTSKTPYLRGIMDAARDPRVKKIALMKCHQSGGSEALNNIIGYFIAHDPCPMLLVHPTAGAAEAWSKERLADMIRTTPALAAVVRDGRQPKASHQAESTLSLKMFPGGFLAAGGANTPNTFARWSVRLAIGDDVDRFPAVVGEEGDPADLLVNRTTSFYDALTVFVSTPTIKGGRIDTLYARSDRRKYFVVCPACGHTDYMTWGDAEHFRVVYGDDAESARIECPGCHERIDEPTRRQMVGRGDWQPTRTADEPGLAGFQLPAMVSTLGDVTLSSLTAKWLSARARGKESLRVFINTSLAEGWEDRGARLEPHTLMRKREHYGPGIDIPAWAVCLTAGIDVQADRFEMQVMGWGPSGERCVIDNTMIPGEPKRPETRTALMEALKVRYTHASGLLLPIHCACIDSGYATDEIYDLVLSLQHWHIFATKGFAGRSGEPIVGKPSEKRSGRSSRPVRLWPVNVDDAKADIMDGLAMAAAGPGYIHFPEKVDEEYFAQLCAEHRETRYNRSGVATHTVWVQDRARNEALDTAVLALAAFRILKPNLQHMAVAIAAAKAGGAPSSGSSSGGGTTGGPSTAQRRRDPVPSSYLGR